MALTATDLCCRALITLGAKPITGFDDATVEADIARHLYPSLRDALLSVHPWRFATMQANLPRLNQRPEGDYGHAFQLPPDFLRALSAGQPDRGRGLVYRISGQRLECNAEAVLLTYICRPDESGFPPFFDLALIARLAAEFCLPLTESTTRAQLLHQLAEAEFRRAKTIDSQQDEPGRIEDFSLVEVRG
ncbi:hypothetical protein [Ferrovibrio sp.]|uniref:hypothetical protein n=1 Tax=Ferrovibrio sp. TaxID=1917215 RepID=UPI0026264181|nr:hypothetical protein [Ferrovibrio sp.]